MVTEPKGTIMCNTCVKVECRHGYPDGIPPYCLATKSREIIERTKTEYSTPDVVDIYKAAGRVVTNGYQKWPRIQEVIEFAKELKLSKIGFASCINLTHELGLVTGLFIGAGFHVVSAICKIGMVSPEDRGVPDLKGFLGSTCNPIAQAEILNSEDTQLNFVLGLCLGHDILFNRYSKAPVSTLIVKDRITGHNPAAALYATHLRQRLWKHYCNKDID